MKTLNEYNADFRKNHFAVMEPIYEDELVAAEQAILDDHTDRVTE